MNAPASSPAGKSPWAISVAVLALFAVVATSGCGKLKARNKLNEGVLAVQAGQNDQGIEDFKQARELDPDLLNAQVYLAVAYANEYAPGAPSDENARIGQQAVIEFQKVLSIAPNDLRAVDGLGKLYFQMATPQDTSKYDQSKQYYLKHIAIKPNDPEPYYQVAAIDWALAHYANGNLRKQYNLANPHKQIQEGDPLPDNIRAEFTQQYGAGVDEGLQMIARAVAINPDNSDALSYQGLLLRQKADQSDSATREALVKQAVEISRKANEVQQKESDSPSKS